MGAKLGTLKLLKLCSWSKHWTGTLHNVLMRVKTVLCLSCIFLDTGVSFTKSDILNGIVYIRIKYPKGSFKRLQVTANR